MLFMTLEMGEVPYVPETVAFMKEVTGLDDTQIILAATHTHGVPFIGWQLMPQEEKTEQIYRRWYQVVQHGMKTAAVEAMQSAQPAKFGYGEGRSYINVNRDEIVDGKYVYGVNCERPSSKRLDFFRIEDMTGKIIATFTNYAVHGVVTNGNMIGDDVWLTGDLPGVTSAMLEEKIGGVALWTSGAAGDQNPRAICNYGYDSEKPFHIRSFGENGFLLLESLASEHVRDILRVNATVKCQLVEAEITSLKRDVLVRKIGSKKGDAPDVPFTLRAVRIGDYAFEGVNAEIVTTIGEKMCDMSDAKHTIMVTHTDGCWGYVPDNWEYDNNALEVSESVVARGCAETAFLEELRDMFESMH